MSTQQQRQQWRELAAAATPGEWEQSNAIETRRNPFMTYIFIVANGEPLAMVGSMESLSPTSADAAFIAAARAAVPALLADVDALQAEAARLMEAGRDMQEQRDGWQEECERARLERSYWCTQAQDERSRREFVAQERDALSAELERVRGELTGVDDFGADCYEWGLDNKTWRPDFAEWLQWKREEAAHTPTPGTR